MKTLFDLSGRVALITGSTKGIGPGVAEHFAQHGAIVVASSRIQADCDAVAAELDTAYGNGKVVAVGHACDVSDLDAATRMIDAIANQFGHIDILVCNAAVLSFGGPSANTPESIFLSLLRTNIYTSFRMCHLVALHMTRPGANIILITSVAGLMPSPEVLAYGVSKSGEMGMARSLAAEFAPQGIRLNCIAPGLIRSDGSRRIWEDKQVLQNYVEKFPIPRIGEPEKIGATAVFLASGAGAYITGAVIPVDGGRSTIG